MTLLPLLLDIAADLSPAGIVIIVGFFLVSLAVAYVAFRVLRKTMKLAFRLALVGLILIVALIGTISIYLFGIGSTPQSRPRPTPSRTR